MSVEFDHNTETYINLANNIEDSLLDKHYPTYIDEETKLPKGFLLVQRDISKATLVIPERKLFAKIFAPYAFAYAQAAYRCLCELGDLDLPIPILKPITQVKSTIFLKLGLHKDRLRFRDLQQDSYQPISEIVTKHGLTPLGLFNTVPVIEIDGKEYLVDPFDDTASSIYDYLHRDK